MKDDKKSTNVSNMSDLLLKGATMLADQCPTCHVPLFQQNEKIFCPNCGREAVYVSSDEEAEKVLAKKDLDDVKTESKDILMGKMKYLSMQLASAEDLDQIERIVDIMNKISLLLEKKI